MPEVSGMRELLIHASWIVVGLALGFALTQYTSGGMLLAFLHKLPGCF